MSLTMKVSNTMYTQLQLLEAIDKLSYLTDEKCVRLIGYLRQQRQGELPDLLQATGLRPRQLRSQLNMLKSVGLIEFSPLDANHYYFNHYRFLRLLCRIYRVIPEAKLVNLS